jgi:hypothetical protein
MSSELVCDYGGLDKSAAVRFNISLSDIGVD